MAMTGVPVLRTDKLHRLRRITVPNETRWWGPNSATLHTGDNATAALRDLLLTAEPQMVAADIETPGTGEARWTMTCITIAFRDRQGDFHSALLDPCRNDAHALLVRAVFDHSSHIVFHNATFDVPPLFAHGMLQDHHFAKLLDTIVLSRLIDTWKPGGRTLEALCTLHGVIQDSNVTIQSLFSAAGHKTKNAGYAETDIDTPAYRIGAMSDTLATLRLWPVLFDRAYQQLAAGIPGSNATADLDPSEAITLIEKVCRYYQIALRSSAYGLNIDPTYAEEWNARQAPAVEAARRELEAVGLEPGVGAHLVNYLSERNELPGDWPLTPSGALKSDKAAMERLSKLGHPLSQAHTTVAEYSKNLNYITTIVEDASVTGRVHPSVNILGAAASGRTSYTSPALQQFSEDARPVIASDGEDWWSVDWSSIEPVVMANCAGDRDFIEPFNNGHDLYVPVAKRAGLIPADLPEEQAVKHPGRKKAKVVLLASMYGQGNKSLAAAQGWTEDEAKAFKAKLKESMRPSFSFMDTIRSHSEVFQQVRTISGRVLDELSPAGEPRSYGSFNHFCQGSAADVLMEATLALDKMGAADGIRLWVHDEMVVTAEYVEAVREAMRTPPEALVRYAAQHRMVPQLLIDSQPLGTRWQKV